MTQLDPRAEYYVPSHIDFGTQKSALKRWQGCQGWGGLLFGQIFIKMKQVNLTFWQELRHQLGGFFFLDSSVLFAHFRFQLCFTLDSCHQFHFGAWLLCDIPARVDLCLVRPKNLVSRGLRVLRVCLLLQLLSGCHLLFMMASATLPRLATTCGLLVDTFSLRLAGNPFQGEPQFLVKSRLGWALRGMTTSAVENKCLDCHTGVKS